MKNLRILALLALFALRADASVVIPFTFAPGDSVSSSKVNANFGAVASEINSHEASVNPHQTTLEQILTTNNSCGTHNIEFNLTQALNFRAQNLGVDPSAATKGRIFFNSTTNLLKYDNGSSIVTLATSASSNPMTTLGDIIYGGVAGVQTRLAGNTTGTVKYLQSTGSAGAATAPTFAQVAYADVSGTPTLRYQTVQTNTTPVTQRSNLNFSSNFLLTDSAGSDRTTVDLSAALVTLLGNTSGTNSGNVTLSAFGAVPNANGASLATQALTLQPADGSNPGGISTSAQTMGAGVKTFSSPPLLSSLTASLPLKLDGSKNMLAQAIALGGAEVSGTLGPTNGGTGQNSWSTGQMLYANGTNTLAKATVGAGQFLQWRGGIPIAENFAPVTFSYLWGQTADFDENTGIASNWNAYADAAGASPVDGTGGSPVVTCTASAATPIRNSGSMVITKDAANRQGNGCSADFTIDNAELGNTLLLNFEYTVGSGTYANGDLALFDYDGTSVTAYSISAIPTQTTGTIKHFTAHVAINLTHGNSHRLIYHVASTSASAYTVKVDWVTPQPLYKVDATEGLLNGAGALTLPAGPETVVGRASTDTLTNKRITRRVVNYTDAATVTLNADTTDMGTLLTLSQATLFANPTGTPTDGQDISIRVLSGTTRALTWGAQFRGGTLVLPTATTGSSKTDYLGFRWNAADSKWDFIASSPAY